MGALFDTWGKLLAWGVGLQILMIAVAVIFGSMIAGLVSIVGMGFFLVGILQFIGWVVDRRKR